MSTTSPTADIRKGLDGVIADSTAISCINPETNSLLYRGYPVHELAANRSVEEVAYLVWNGELPTSEQLAEFESVERSHRALPEIVRAVIDAVPTSAHPMDIVRTAISVIGAADPTTEVSSPHANESKAVRLFAVLPAIVAYDQRRRRGLDLVEPRYDLGYAENFLHQTFGRVPDGPAVDAFRVSMILYAEHGFNASTFAARVIASTLSDLYSAVTGAVGALKGTLHGGANEAVMHAFDEIGSVDRVDAWLDNAFNAKRKIMGFGHRVYKNGDSRVPTMSDALAILAEHAGRNDLLDTYHALELAMDTRKNVKPNLDYPAGPLYRLIGFDTLTFTPLFVAARVIGWTAHVIEQYESNSLIRPLSVYTGSPERHVDEPRRAAPTA